MERLVVSKNRRFLATESGRPFFWLGDTAWELFHRLTLDEARIYFSMRARQRFTIIQAVLLAEIDGLRVANPYGEVPFHDLDPERPNEAYFGRVDQYVEIAAAHGLYMALLPTWGDKVCSIWGVGPVVFDPDKARAYGRFLGAFFRHRTNIVWVLGGDRPAVHDQDDHRPVWRALAEGLDEGAGRRDLKTYHPNGGHSSSDWLQDEAWLDLHMMQSGHGSGRDVPVWEWVARDYAKAPIRPVLDGEPNYEDHPVSPWPKWDARNGYFRDHDVRKQLYRSVLAGGCGVTYGHHFVWQMWRPGWDVLNNGEEFIPWYEALGRPAACQVRHLRALVESRPFFTRIPAADLVVDPAPEALKQRRDRQPVASRDAHGRFALVYFPLPLSVTIDTSVLAGGPLRAWWYDPISGHAEEIGDLPKRRYVTLTPPGHTPDRVLVIDDRTAEFPAPGSSVVGGRDA